jgi:hypothetical protein
MPTGKHRRSLTTDLPSSNGHRTLVTRVCRSRAAPADLGDLEDRVGPEVRDRAALEGLDRAGREDQVDREAQGLGDLAARVGLGVLEDTNRAALGIMADTGPADLENLEDRVGLEAQAGLEDMNLADRENRVDRAVRDLGQNRVRPDRMPVEPDRPRLDRMPVGPDRILAEPERPRLHRIRAHPQDPTHLVEVTRPLEPTHLVAVIRPGEATHPAEATHPRATSPGGLADNLKFTLRNCATANSPRSSAVSYLTAVVWRLIGLRPPQKYCACVSLRPWSLRAPLTRRHRLVHGLCLLGGNMINVVRFVAASAAMAAGLGLAGLDAAAQAQAQPSPFPQWCPGDFWDPGRGPNWDWGGCHDNWRGPGPNPHPDPHWGPGWGPGEPPPDGPDGPGGPNPR